MVKREEQPSDGVTLPGYALTGSAFVLVADGRVLRPETMQREAQGRWRSGSVTVSLSVSVAEDGSEGLVLRASGIRHVEEVCLLDHDIDRPPTEIYNHRWFDDDGMQQSTAVFLRDEHGGAFASWANPFGRMASSGSHLRLWYRPALTVPDGTFCSDPLVTGSWRREGRELRFEARPDRDGSPGNEPAYVRLLAAKRPVVLDAGEARALRRAVAARLRWQPARARSAHWAWGENLHRLAIADSRTQAIHRRLAELCEEIGIEIVVLEPGVGDDRSPSDEGPWQHIMWLGMGPSVGHGQWRPQGTRAPAALEAEADPEPEGVRALLATAREHHVASAAYVNPQFPWLFKEQWRLVPPALTPEAYGHAALTCLAVPEARNWLIETVRSFVDEYGLSGVSLDFVVWRPCHATDHPHPPGEDSLYPQWDGYRRLVAALRENSESWIEGLIGAPSLMPWGAAGLTHPAPLVWDNQPQWVPAWPDLSLDRTCANLQRRAAWWYRNLAMLPSFKVPGAVGHQANRLREPPVERGWDWEGARFNLLSAVATGPSSLSFSYLPCWDSDEWSAVRTRDGAFFASWVRFAQENAALLANLEDLYDEARPGAVDGTIATDENGSGFVFLVNPDYVEHRCEVPLDDGRLLRERHPEPGRLWGSTVVVESHQVHVLELVREAEIVRPALLGALGSVDTFGRVTTAKGRPGSVVRVEALVDGGRVRSTIVFDEDGIASSLGPFSVDDQPVAPTDAEGDVVLSTSWTPGRALPKMLAELAPPVLTDDPEHLQPWSDPSRLQLFIEHTAPQEVSMRATIDGEPIEVRRAYVGTFEDVTDTELFPVGRHLLGHYLDLTTRLATTVDLERPWHIGLEIDGLVKGSFLGVHVAHLPRRTTTKARTIDFLSSPWLETAADMATEAPILPGTTMVELLTQHSRRPDPPGAVLEHDVVYGTGRGSDLLCSIYRRADPAEARAAVVLVHGGGWAGGDRAYHTRHAHHLAELGYVSANVEYRLHPNARWPDSLEDVKCAIRFLRAHAAELGIDPARIAVAGGSAGGQLAAMTALTPGSFEGSGGWQDQPSTVQAAVLFYPPTDLVARRDRLPDFLAEIADSYFAAHAGEASPVNHVHEGAPPILTITGSADQLIELSQVQRFHDELTENGVVNRLEVCEGRDHAFDLFGPEWRADWPSTTELMVEFLAEHLGGP